MVGRPTNGRNRRKSLTAQLQQHFGQASLKWALAKERPPHLWNQVRYVHDGIYHR